MSEDSGPVQSTTVPSEYVCRTLKEYVFAASVDARNWKTASSSVGTLPPVQVTFWMTVFSPVPVVWASRFQPGGRGERVDRETARRVSSTFVVAAFSFSVGTASVKNCPFLATTTGGLTFA